MVYYIAISEDFNMSYPFSLNLYEWFIRKQQQMATQIGFLRLDINSEQRHFEKKR